MKLTTRSQLTPEESARFTELRSIVQRGLKNFVDVGNALLEISDRRLYRKDHSTFKEFVGAEYGMSVSRAYQLCEAAEVVKSLPPQMSTLVDNEGQARALAKVEPKKRAKILKVVAEKGPVTAKAIKEEITPNEHEGADEYAGQANGPSGKPFDVFKATIELACATIPPGEDLTKYILVLAVESRKLTNQQRLSQPSVQLSAYTR